MSQCFTFGHSSEHGSCRIICSSSSWRINKTIILTGCFQDTHCVSFDFKITGHGELSVYVIRDFFVYSQPVWSSQSITTEWTNVQLALSPQSYKVSTFRFGIRCTLIPPWEPRCLMSAPKALLSTAKIAQQIGKFTFFALGRRAVGSRPTYAPGK